MSAWIVEDARAVASTDAVEYDASYRLKLTRDEERAESMVEFAAPSAVASGGYAQEALAPYLSDDVPPQRLVVERNGTVRIASSEARTPAARVERARRTTGQPGSGRARKRSRR